MICLFFLWIYCLSWLSKGFSLILIVFFRLCIVYVFSWMLNIQIKMIWSGLSAVNTWMHLFVVGVFRTLSYTWKWCQVYRRGLPECLARARTPDQTLLTMPSESSSGNEEGASDYSLWLTVSFAPCLFPLLVFCHVGSLTFLCACSLSVYRARWADKGM